MKTSLENKLALENAVFKMTEQNPYYSILLQQLVIKYSIQVPTAGITYNKKTGKFEVLINPEFFHSLKQEERVAIFLHEVLHFVYMHLNRFPMNKSMDHDQKKKANIACDMAINQYINHLPKGAIKVDDWIKSDGTQYPKYRTAEEYLELIGKELQDQKQKSDENEPDKSGKPKKGSDDKGNTHENMNKYSQFDEHDWEELTEEEKKEMLKEAKDVLTRSIEKAQFTHTLIPSNLQDMMKEIDTLSAKINYKQILHNTIKKTVSAAERENTWKRPNSRYGIYSPGKRTGDLPNLTMYVDTSGSISHTELNQFLDVISSFLKVGVRNCFLGLWNTELYYKKKYKLNSKLDSDVIQSGGTDLGDVVKDISKFKPNLSIILTDMYLDLPDLKNCKEQIIFIVSQNGNKMYNKSLPSNCKLIHLDNLV